MQYDESALNQFFQQFSEESLYQLLGVVSRRARRLALAAAKGDGMGDLAELRLLQKVISQAHTRRLAAISPDSANIITRESDDMHQADITFMWNSENKKTSQ